MSQPQPDNEPATPLPRIVNPEEAAAAARDKAPIEVEDPSLNPLAQETYSFEIDVVDGAGKRWAGKFKNKILSIEESMNVGLTKAGMTGNTPWFALDPADQATIEMVAHLTHSLVSKPAWFILHGKDAIKNVRLLNAVYGEVSAHESTFRGPAPASPASSG
jgi:hypothetical protein